MEFRKDNMSEYCKNCYELQQQLDKYSQALTEIKQLLEDALDTDKTSAEQSFDNIHKAIKLCEVLDE